VGCAPTTKACLANSRLSSTMCLIKQKI
jgi:hypothetical protein